MPIQHSYGTTPASVNEQCLQNCYPQLPFHSGQMSWFGTQADPWWHWLLEWDICTVTLWPDWPTSHLSARPLDFIILWPWRHIEAITGSQQAHKPANLSQFFFSFLQFCSWPDCQILLTSAKESKYSKRKGKKERGGRRRRLQGRGSLS